MTSTLTSRGRIKIPAEIRRKLRLTPGVKLEIILEDDSTIRIIPKKVSIKDLSGFLPAPPKSVTIEEMKESIAEGAARQ